MPDLIGHLLPSGNKDPRHKRRMSTRRSRGQCPRPFGERRPASATPGGLFIPRFRHFGALPQRAFRSHPERSPVWACAHFFASRSMTACCLLLYLNKRDLTLNPRGRERSYATSLTSQIVSNLALSNLSKRSLWIAYANRYLGRLKATYVTLNDGSTRLSPAL